MAEALKPCPFCGVKPVHRQIPNDGSWLTDCNTVNCIRPSTGLRRTKAEAVAAWNQRHLSPSAGDAEALREAVEAMRPFVWTHEPWMDEHPDNQDTGLRACVTWGDYRRAIRALADLGGAG